MAKFEVLTLVCQSVTGLWDVALGQVVYRV